MKTKLIISILTVLMFLVGCDRIRQKTKENLGKVGQKTWEKFVDRMSEPTIKNYSLFEAFPELKRDEFKINEVNGILCEYIPFFYKYYFKYSGDIPLIKQYISNIEYSYTEIPPDTALVKSNFADFDKKTLKKDMTEYEMQKVKFFFAYKELYLDELEFYTCCKTPELHYIVFDLKNNFIYHMIENFRE